ncbi:hypothetical protein K493DRAFT_341432, partial [Basidiobolus meristosporus CBS 931.73]
MPSKLDTKSLHYVPVNGISTSKFALLHSLQQKASRAFLLRQYGPAWTTCLDGLSELQSELDTWLGPVSPKTSLPAELLELRRRFWVLYINIFGLKERQERQHHNNHQAFEPSSRPRKASPEGSEIWNIIVASYQRTGDEVDVEVVIACVLLYINKNLGLLARDIVEHWLTVLPDSTIDSLELVRLERESTQIDEDSEISRLWLSYEKIVELYVLHILPKLAEWDTAREFLRYNPIISASRKGMYQQRVERLFQRSLRPRKRSSLCSLSSHLQTKHAQEMAPKTDSQPDVTSDEASESSPKIDAVPLTTQPPNSPRKDPPSKKTMWTWLVRGRAGSG